MSDNQSEAPKKQTSGKNPRRKNNAPQKQAGTQAGKKGNRPPQNKAKRGGQGQSQGKNAPGKGAPKNAQNKNNRKRQAPRPKQEQGESQQGPRAKNVVTKKPVWGDAKADAPTQKQASGTQKSNNRSRKNRGRGGNSGGKNPPREPQKKLPKIQSDENGIFDFSEDELAEDKALQVISRGDGETKYANFEEYLKDH